MTSTPRATLNVSDTIHDAFAELSMLNVIVKVLEGRRVLLDRDRLARLGYILIYDHVSPVFCKISDIQRFHYDPVIYVDDVVPFATLASYSLITIKDDYSSF